MPTIITTPTEELSLKISRLLTLKKHHSTARTSKAIESLDVLLSQVQSFIQEISDVDIPQEDILEDDIGEEDWKKRDQWEAVDRECMLVTPPPTPKKEYKDKKIFLAAIQSLNIPIFSKSHSPTSPKDRFSFSKTFKSLIKSHSLFSSHDAHEQDSARKETSLSLEYTNSAFF